MRKYLTITHEPPMWPSYRDQYVVLRSAPERLGFDEVARFEREHLAKEFVAKHRVTTDLVAS